MVNYGDFWGFEDDVDMVDDYGVDFNFEDEEEGEVLLFIERVVWKQKVWEVVVGIQWSEEEIEDEEEEKEVIFELGFLKVEEVDGGLQINVDEELFVLFFVGEMEQDVQVLDL